MNSWFEEYENSADCWLDKTLREDDKRQKFFKVVNRGESDAQLEELLTKYRKNTLWCMVMTGKWSTPRVVKVNNIFGNELRIVEYGYGESSTVIKASSVVKFGDGTKLQTELNTYKSLQHQIDKCKESF